MENNYWIEDGLLIFKPSFNEDLINYYDIINKYKKIIFSNYNDPLIAIKTNNKNENEIEYDYNYIENKFNKEIDLSNNINLTHLTFGCNFNKKINISLNIKSINMYGCNNQFIIDNLHNNIEELKIYETNLNLDNLPNSIKKIYINYYKKELNNLPNSIEYLELIDYNLKIRKFPKNLKTIKCDKHYKYIDDFKDYTVIKN